VSATFELACLDMAGTTVADGGLVEQAFDQALLEMDIGPAHLERPRMVAYVRDTMGTSKIEVFRALFDTEDAAQAANTAFEGAFNALVAAGGAEALPGARETIDALRGAGVRVALTTGFAPETRDVLLDALGWRDAVDLAVSPADAGRGRPYPDMIELAMRRLGADDPATVAVAGDTRADIEAGLASGAAVVAGVLTGSDDEHALNEAGATHVLRSIGELPAVLGRTAHP
jgi:phosphonatase-like hydrolase